MKLSYEKKMNMGSNARSLIEKKFDEKIVIEKYNDIVEKLSF